MHLRKHLMILRAKLRKWGNTLKTMKARKAKRF